jgi:hypothetical protein
LFIVNHAPKTADIILRHCAWWKSGGWIIKGRKLLSSLILVGDILFQTGCELGVAVVKPRAGFRIPFWKI